MAATHGVGTYGNGAGTVTPLDHKMAQLGHIVKTAANTIRAGLFWDGSATIISGKANMSLDIRAFTAVLSRGATAGAVLLTNDAVLNLTTDSNGATLVAPGSNSVYWNVFVWQREFSIDGTNSNPVISVLVGTSAPSPTVPALTSFPGAVSLGTVLVPAGTTATNSGTTITQTAPFTAATGGVVPVRTSTERDAGSWQAGQLIYRLDQDWFEKYSGSAWAITGGRLPRFRKSTASTQTLSANTLTALTSLGTADIALFGFTESAGVFTTQFAGLIQVFCRAELQAAGAAFYVQADVMKNGSPITNGPFASGSGNSSMFPFVELFDEIQVAAGDTITFRVAPFGGTSVGRLMVGAQYVSPV